MVTNSGGFMVLVVLRCPEVPAHFERHFGPKLTRFGGQTRKLCFGEFARELRDADGRITPASLEAGILDRGLSI